MDLGSQIARLPKKTFGIFRLNCENVKLFIKARPKTLRRKEMKRTVFALAITLVLVFSLVIPTSAVTDGVPDGSGHPYVGLMVADDASGAPLWRCSGTLIAPTIFLTAGHCTEAPAARATIWFETDIQSNQAALGYPYGGATSVDGTVYTHPLFDSAAFYLHDLGVVVLDHPVVMSSYGALPKLGLLDSYKTKRGVAKLSFTSVGYGMQRSFPDATAWKDQSFKIRMVAYPRLVQIGVPGAGDDFSIQLSNNANTGGTCFGDSGGPNFFKNTNIVAGVTSYGKNGNCAGSGGVYRVDTKDDLDWLATFGVHP
jgi:V8-like Glu-specific endopeptidase